MADLEQVIREGGAVVLPTETVYGLFAKALDEKAVEYVYRLKKRPKDKAMNLNVANYQSILAYSKNQPDYLKELYENFLPGPLTIILQANDQVPSWINSGLTTIGFRVPKHPLTLKLIEKIGPLIGPSANISGQSSGKIFTDIIEQFIPFDETIQGYADDRALTRVDSTILDLSTGYARILRQGAIAKEEILEKVPQIPFL